MSEINAHILILNGPNLDQLGKREAKHYGKKTLSEINAALENRFPQLTLTFVQSNYEGALVESLHKWAVYDGIILNAAAYTHSSYALHDALMIVRVPVVEVHFSNIHAREPWRQTSVIAPACTGTIAGFGPRSYALALQWMQDIIAEGEED